MTGTRIATALVLLVAFLAALFWLPAPFWLAATLVVAALAAWEWTRVARLDGMVGSAFILLVPAVGIACRWLAISADVSFRSVPYVVATLFWVAAAPLWLGRLAHVSSRPVLILAGLVVIVPTWLALVDLRALSPSLLLVVMSVVWISDTAAYFTGRAIGRHKLAPAISPGKTWEGVGGALFAVAVFAAVAVPLLAGARDGGLALLGETGLKAIPAALVVCVLGVEGDLFESWLKRGAGMKDSSALLPGHGGILDRIDALTSTLPVAALLLGFARRAA